MRRRGCTRSRGSPSCSPPAATGSGDGSWLHRARSSTIANIHNPSYPYTVNMMRLGTATEAEILHIERHIRVRWMQPFLDSLEPQLAAGAPVFFTGDFNAPSWRDWTPEVVDALGWQPTTLNYRAPRFSVRWPTSLVMERGGVPRLVPRGAARRDRRAGLHLDVRPSGHLPVGRVRPDRLRVGRRLVKDALQPRDR